MLLLAVKILAAALASGLAGLGLGLFLGRRANGEVRRLSVANRALHEQLERARSAAARPSPASETPPVGGATTAPTVEHEFRTPLNAIIGFADVMLLNDAAEPLSRRQRQAMDHISSAGRRLLSLVETMLARAETVADVPALASETVDVRLATRQICDLLRPQAEARGVALGPPFGPSGLAVVADRSRMRQVLSTLIARLVDICLVGGEVRVELRRMRDFVEVDVRAVSPLRGPATPNAVPSPAWGAFAASDMAAAQRLAVAMGGRIETVEASGQGSAPGFGMTLMLPPAGAAYPALPVRRRPAAPPGPRRATLLYVEDDASNVVLMRRVIETLGGFELFIGETGHQGLAMAQDIRPDVILLDVNLPGMDGFAVKARLDLDPATRDVPVIALSADASTEDRRRGAEAGFLDYLAKPIDIPALAAALNRAVGEEVARLRRHARDAA